MSSLHLILIIHILINLYSATSFAYGSQDDVEKVYVRKGGKATLPCLPAEQMSRIFKLEWWKEDKKLVEIEDERMTIWEAEVHVAFLPETGALVFNNVQYTDTGDYTCVVNNNRRSDGIVRFFIQDVPDPPGRPLVIGFTSRTVNLSWTSSPDVHHSPILHYIIHVRLGESGDWDKATPVMTPDNGTSYQVLGLQPYNVYTFRIIAVNAIGASLPSVESFPMVTLREVPNGKPTIMGHFNESSSSVRIQWAPPPKESIHGEFLGYVIKYRKRDKSEPEIVQKLKSSSLRDYTIKDLKPFTQYTVSLQVFNPEGEGPPAAVVVMTDEGTPSAPRNLTVFHVDDTSIKIKWLEPEFPNGIIREYRVYVLDVHLNRTEVRTAYDPQPVKTFTITNLRPFTQYKVWVKAYTGRYEGNSSLQVTTKTDVQGPSAPSIVNLTCSSLDSLFLQWDPPAVFYNNIDYYFVSYRSEESNDFKEIELSAGLDTRDNEIFITNLTANMLYEVRVQGASRSIRNAELYRGDYSPARKVVLQSFPVHSGMDSSISASLIAGVVCASFALILAIISFILWTKYFQAAYYYLDDPPSQTRGGSPQLSETYDDSEYVSVPVPLWSKHVQDLHADGDIGFSREYEAIQAGLDSDLSCEYSQMVENKNKNRYVNIVAYDHTRVVLKTLNGQKKGAVDYINANYIDGYCKPRAYIGTQGPLPSTFDDYWRMIWEQRVCIIVMITNLIERGRHHSSCSSELDDTRKCDQYWPKEGIETYGVVQVKLLQEVIMATYTLRTFQIKNLKKSGSERTVYQYHYTNWPDHGVPDHPLPVLSFVRKSSAANPPNGGPIIVHCSAGVGRTGTYIVVDAMLKQIKHRQSVNVYGFLKHIRQQRNYLVQTEEQYIFIHDAILEAIESGDTEVPSSHLSRYIQTLQTGGDLISNASSDIKEKPIHWPLLERQYKLVTSFRAKDFNVVSALKPCNKGKNRSLNLIPLESHRVHITPRAPGTDGSDYINATFFPGFNLLKEFIVTQHPVDETFADFWQMVWDHNAQTIVVLSSIYEEKEFPQFWPEKEDDCDYGSFKVKLTEENTIIQDSGGVITTRDFIMQSTQDDYELTCRLVHCPGWPETCGPLNSVFDLIKIVQTWHLEFQNGPIIVMDRYGGTEAATFCCLTTLYKQLNFEDCVDVYMYAKLYHLRRPGIWRSQDDYLFLYRAVESVVSTLSIGDAYDGSPYGSQMNVNNGLINTNGHAVKINISSDHSVKSESLS